MTASRCILMAMVAMAVWATPLHARRAADASMPANRLWQLAAQEQAILEQSGVILHDAALDSYLEGVVARLWKQTGSGLKVPVVQVTRDVRMEAYTYPNGYIFLTSGIFTPIKNEDQLAMIIAHEMVHYVRQHAVEVYDQFQTPSHDRGVQVAPSRSLTDVKRIEKKIKAEEYQADSDGLAIIRGAGYCQADVLALISNFISSLKGHASPEGMRDLARRKSVLTALIQPNAMQPGCPSTSTERTEHFRSRVAPVWMANAQVLLRQGDWVRADKSIATYLALRPQDASAYYLQGEIMRRRNDGDHKNESIRYYQEALKINPRLSTVYRALGELYFKAGRYRQAKSYFEAFLSLAPRDEANAYVKGYLRQCQN